MPISERAQWLRTVQLYGAAVVFVALTIGLLRLLGTPDGNRPILLPFVAPILFSAYLGGLGPGLFATGMVAVWTLLFVLEPVQAFSISHPADVFLWAVLCGLGVLISVLSQALHCALHRQKETQRRNAELLVQQRETEIRQAEATRLNTFVEKAPIGVVFGDANGGLYYANDEYLRMIRRDRKDLEGGLIRWDQITSPEWLSVDRDAIASLQDEQFVRYEKEYVLADGTRVPVLIGLMPHDHELACFVLDLSREKRTEKELLFFKHLTEQTSEPFYAVSPAEGFRFVYVNQAACVHFGRTRDEMMTLSISEIDPLFPPDVCAEFRKRLKQGRTSTFETLHRHADGHDMDVEVSTTSFQCEGKELFAGWFHDISQRKAVDRELRESEEKFRTVAENARAVFGIVQENKFVYANKYLVEASGYSLEEIYSMPFIELVHPSYRAIVADRAKQRIMGQPVPNQYDFLMAGKNGKERWIELTVSAIQYKGKPAIIGTGFDVTDRKRAEDALRESEERLRLAIESAKLLQWEWDSRTDVWTWTNPDPSWGPGPKTTANSHEFLSQMHQDDRPRVQDLLGQAMDPAGAGQYAAEFRFLRPDGQYRWLSARGRIFFEESQGIRKPARALGMSVDVTGQKAAQEMLAAAKEAAEQARATAEEANQAKDRFMAVLSHELRTPLTPVLASVSLMQKDVRFDRQMHDDLEMIRRNVELEARLIDDLLDLTRIVRGKVELDKRPIDLMTVIHRAIEVCRPDIQARGLNFGLRAEPGQYILEGDAARLQQVFWNILKNSVKFTPHGGCVGMRCGFDKGDQLFVEIYDSGVGLEPDQLNRIFDAFAQADPTIAKKFGGLGLGLAISRSLVEMHGGTIEAHSLGKGKGASFQVRLPSLIQSDRQPQSSWVQYPGANAPTALRSLNILLVEDHGDTAEMLKRMLEQEGHQVQTAGDVKTALEMLRQARFDLLVSDLGLPDGSGLDLIREVRAEGNAFPAIALSGYGQEQDVRQTREAGFTAHIVKPVDMERLLAAIESITTSSVAAG